METTPDDRLLQPVDVMSSRVCSFSSPSINRRYCELRTAGKSTPRVRERFTPCGARAGQLLLQHVQRHSWRLHDSPLDERPTQRRDRFAHVEYY